MRRLRGARTRLVRHLGLEVVARTEIFEEIFGERVRMSRGWGRAHLHSVNLFQVPLDVAGAHSSRRTCGPQSPTCRSTSCPPTYSISGSYVVRRYSFDRDGSRRSSPSFWYILFQRVQRHLRSPVPGMRKTPSPARSRNPSCRPGSPASPDRLPRPHSQPKLTTSRTFSTTRRVRSSRRENLDPNPWRRK